MIKRIRRMAALLTLCAIMLCGCAPIVAEPPETLSVYASFYPIYALADMIACDVPDLDLHCLVQPQDGCLRSYSLSDWDLYLLGYSADALLIGGSGLESFEASVSGSNDLALSKVLHGIELYTDTDRVSDEESHFSGDNPHIYMSVDGGMQILENITSAMSVMDARYAEVYEENLGKAMAEMESLKQEITGLTSVLRGEKVILMNETLIYAAMDYGLEFSMPYERESSETQYSSEIQNCLSALSGSEAQVVLIEQQAPETLVIALEKAGFVVAKLNVLSTMSESDGSSGYMAALYDNAVAVKKAFDKINAEM